MIIKKSEVKIIPAEQLSNISASKFNYEEVDATMLTNIMLDRMTEMGGVALSGPR